MEICHKVPDSTLYPIPQTLSHPECFRIYNLQGAEKVKYYTDGSAHGFITTKRILTEAKYTSQHRAFNIKGADKYAVGYLNDNEYRPNKIEFINLKTGEKMFCFDAYIPGERFLAFRINSEDGDIAKHRWGIFDMLKDKMIIQASVKSEDIAEIHRACELASASIEKYADSNSKKAN